MNIENIKDWILPFAVAIGGTIATFLFTFSKYSDLKEKTDKEKDGASEKLISLLKETAEAERIKAERLREENQTMKEDFQRQITDLKEGHQKQINEIKLQMKELKTLYEASERSKQEYLEILKDKNPEQVEFMKLLTEAATASNKTQKEAKDYMDNTGKALKEILFFMKDLHDRNKRVDKEVK